MVEGAPAHGKVAHLLPLTYKRYVADWLEEDTPSFDYGGFVVGEEQSEAKLLGKSEVRSQFPRVRNLLLGERVALNTLARCSGIATKSNRLLTLLRKAGYQNILAGTRKTTPGFRLVEKYGMLVGGVDAHRVDLSHMTMLKDNHIVAAGSITNAVRAAKSAGGFATKVEVECQSFEEADEAIAAGADIVMLDNFTPDGVKVAAAQLKEKWGRGTGDRNTFLVEVSGGLTEYNVEKYVCGDIDIVSTSSIHQESLHIQERQSPTSSTLSFQISDDRLLELYYEYFWPAFPIVLPLEFFQSYRMLANHALGDLLLVLEWIGSLYASWCPSETYYQAALEAMSSASLARTPFTVQALMLFAIAQHHQDMRPESRKILDLAILIALELDMNKRDFARLWGEGNPVLEEAWRRTWYMLSITDQHFAIVMNSPIYQLANMPISVDLPCDDEFYEAGQIPTPATYQEMENRELADIEVVYSSIAYLHDMCRTVAYVMNMFATSSQFSRELIDTMDAKIAIWHSLLPSVKRDPMRKDGTVDEVIYTAHMIGAIVLMTMHRPFSSLIYNKAELSTTAFSAPAPFSIPPATGRSAHTARALRVAEIQTKLLAIPCTIEKHSVFSMCICAQIATAQISACNNLLEDHALSIARDRVKLSIGFLNAMGSIWALGKAMAKDVRAVARSTLAMPSSTVTVEPDSTGEIEIPRDELIWPVDPSAGIDIYSGIVLPMDWENSSSSYASSALVHAAMFQTSGPGGYAS
ncbi:nicotinate-nucleotide diphosphorylase [Macroventuria anomochaeta]|uniref:Nicotinate-nucleotide diphosphorylase n=1 Tax=Macroventuria anomochaeta TaxID=301207 RepID=A0ACB6S8G8_9PLEO|nr:nicotinate-nucleotide diphosphorylase [Macroventuria anomochaeta]KAF2629875.1 nicotinate-nucleotide diphosphorylase [Macroventuria anomochaeta]